MKLVAMIRTHDDLALESLSSKGLLRRAHRDLDAGKGTVNSVSEEDAVITIGDETVNILAKGPQESSCTCKASGVCRHIILSILMLRDHAIDSTIKYKPSNLISDKAGNTPGNDAPITTASEDICAITEARLEKLAGADWDKALSLFYSAPAVSIKSEGVNASISFDELNATVTLIAGNELKDAAYKGPKARKRQLTIVAALLIRKKRGIEFVSPENNVAAQGVSKEFIQQAQKTIEQAVAATLPGRSALGPDLFLDLAISTRCEALPRLSAELRGLSKLSQMACDHHAEFEPSVFLQLASRSYALLEALRAAPSDISLSGSVRREYVKNESMDLWPLGVGRWRSKTGAIGLSAYMLEPASGRWLILNEGRAADTDPTFEVHSAYQMSLWGAGTLVGTQGHALRVAEPYIASDDSLSAKGHGAVRFAETISLESLTACDAAHKDWLSLKKAVANRMQTGIRRRQTPVPALIVPKKYGQLGFDELNQIYKWEVTDEFGQVLVLYFPAADEESAIRLWRLGREIKAMVVECKLQNNSLNIRPVAVITQQKKMTSLHNIDFDYWPRESGFKKMISSYREKLAKPLKLSYTELDPVKRVLADTADELVTLIDTGESVKMSLIVDNLLSCGLVTLADQLKQLVAMGPTTNSDNVRSLLGASYVVSELCQLETFK